MSKETPATSELIGIKDYVAAYYDGNNAAFARAHGIHPQQVTNWIGKGFKICGHELWSKRRELNPPPIQPKEKL